MIESIRIQNYKALRDVTLKLTPIHVLIGKNDSGKTSILEAITALCRSVDYRLRDSFLGRWQNDELIWHHSNSPVISIETKAWVDRVPVIYSLAIRFGPDRNCIVSKEVVIAQNGTAYDLTKAAQEFTDVRNHAWETGYETRGPKELVVGVHDAISDVHTCRWSAKMLGLPVAFASDNNPFDDGDSGFGLALKLDDILGNSRDQFVRLEKEFREIFPQFKAIRLVREPGYKVPANDFENVPKLSTGSGKGIRFDFENGLSDVPASQVSDGVLIVLGYLALLYSTNPPRMLLIEEPENGVHFERLTVVLGLLRRIEKNHPRTQILLTTHSPYLVDHFDPTEVTLCHKESDGSVSLHRLSENPSVKKQASIFTLGEIWTGEGDDDLAKAQAGTSETAP